MASTIKEWCRGYRGKRSKYIFTEVDTLLLLENFFMVPPLGPKNAKKQYGFILPWFCSIKLRFSKFEIPFEYCFFISVSLLY